MTDSKSLVSEEREYDIARFKYLRLEFKVLDTDCMPKQLEHAEMSLYEWLKYWKEVYENENNPKRDNTRTFLC